MIQKIINIFAFISQFFWHRFRKMISSIRERSPVTTMAAATFWNFRRSVYLPQWWYHCFLFGLWNHLGTTGSHYRKWSDPFFLKCRNHWIFPTFVTCEHVTCHMWKTNLLIENSKCRNRLQVAANRGTCGFTSNRKLWINFINWM